MAGGGGGGCLWTEGNLLCLNSPSSYHKPTLAANRSGQSQALPSRPPGWGAGEADASEYAVPGSDAWSLLEKVFLELGALLDHPGRPL